MDKRTRDSQQTVTALEIVLDPVQAKTDTCCCPAQDMA